MPLRKRKVIWRPSLETFQDCANAGSSSCVWRFTRTSTPPVRYRIEAEASSSTFRGSNVLGSMRIQNLSSPPPWASARPSRDPKQHDKHERNLAFLFHFSPHFLLVPHASTSSCLESRS